ncbi:MAG: SOS response-associated peptidase [Chloroflexi bacterium]|nr:SOS response-associated peptidase [Chloroflexota bacterium]
MCGRFTLHTSLKQIEQTFHVEPSAVNLPPNYNVSPTQDVLTVVQRDGVNHLEAMRWGLIPFWAKDHKIGARMINARAETVSSSAAFKRPLKSQRCLVVADGFYEWRKQGTKKIPMFIRLKSHAPFGFAGLYDTWKAPSGEPVVSCTIITTDANPLVAPIHNRMPVIIPQSEHTLWLDPDNADLNELSLLLQPYSEQELEAYEVSPMVNKTSNNASECIAPLAS